MKEKRPKTSSNVALIDVAAVEARMDELRKVNLDEGEDPAAPRAYVAEMLRSPSALQTQERALQACRSCTRRARSGDTNADSNLNCLANGGQEA